MKSILDRKQSSLVRDLKAAISDLSAELDDTEVGVENGSAKHLREAAAGLDGLFTLVVTGEFNSGKSALINALLGAPYLEEGVTPTTREVQVLTYGPEVPPDRVDDHVLRRLPAPVLEQMEVVDTPGTNAIIRSHETLTRQFVPRADLVLFVTSADRPFAESERVFLEVMRNWRKPIIFVVNKIDLLGAPHELAEVVDFVGQGARELLGAEPTIFALSAREALRAIQSEDEAALRKTGWRAFTDWLRETLTARERLRLKLLNPLGVAERCADDALEHIETRTRVLSSDGEAIEQVERDIASFAESTLSELDQRLDAVDKELMGLRERGEAFLDQAFRITRLRDLLNEDRLRRLFEDEVVGAAPERVEAEVGGLIDWLVEREHAQWEAVQHQLAARQGETEPLAQRSDRPGFAARRRELLATVGHESQRAVAQLDPERESERLVLSVQDALAQTAMVEVGAIGLGLVLKAVLISAAADATGLVAAGIVAVFGLTLLPHRRRQAAEALRERTAEVRIELRRAISTAVEEELECCVRDMRAVVRPYAEFLASEQTELENRKRSLVGIRKRLRALAERIGEVAGREGG